MKKEINITIAGTTKTGKSTVLLLIKHLLTELGFEVNKTPDYDYLNDNDFDQKISSNLIDRINSLKGKVKINITEKQIGTKPIYNPPIVEQQLLDEMKPEIEMFLNTINQSKTINEELLLDETLIENLKLWENKYKI